MVHFNNLLGIGVVAVAVPLLLGLFPAAKIPAVVFEIVGGIVVGPAILGWVHLDVAVNVTSDLGLGFLLFLAGFEIDLRLFDRRTVVVVGRAFLASAGLALVVGYGLQYSGLILDGLLVGITLMATSLGVLVPILKDVEEARTGFGRLIMAGGSVAELAPLVLLSAFFSAKSTDATEELSLLVGFVAFSVVAIVVIQRVRSWGRLREVVDRLENTSAQLRVRVAITLALGFGVVAEHAGLAMILGAFLAGVIIRQTDVSAVSYAQFEGKLEAIGFGFLIPVFFVATGADLDVTSLFHSVRAVVEVPVFLVALLVVRALPALLYKPIVGLSRAVAAGFMQATSLTLIVVSSTIGLETHHLRASTAAALVIAGLLSVVVYPPLALRLMRRPVETQLPAAPLVAPEP